MRAEELPHGVHLLDLGTLAECAGRAVDDPEPLLDDGRLADNGRSLGIHVALAGHLDEERRLIAELVFGFHLDSGLLELLLAGVILDEVVLVPGATADDEIQGRVEVLVGPLLGPLPLDGLPMLELEPLHLRLPRPLPRGVQAVEVGVAELAPRVRDRVGHGDRYARRHAVIDPLRELAEGPRRQREEVAPGQLLDERLEVRRAPLGVEHRDRSREVKLDFHGAGQKERGVGLPAPAESLEPRL